MGKAIAFAGEAHYNGCQDITSAAAPVFLECAMKTEEKLNMTMLCDFYELTMGYGYWNSAYKD